MNSMVVAMQREVDGLFSSMEKALLQHVFGKPGRHGYWVMPRPPKRRSVMRAAKAYMRASEPGVRYRKQYRAKMRYWKREEKAKPSRFVTHGW